MWVTAAVLMCSMAIGVMCQAARDDGPRGGILYGAVTFILGGLASIAAAIAEPYLTPAWLKPATTIFEKQLSPGGLVLSFMLQRLFDYGPIALVTAIMFLLVCTGKPAAKSGRMTTPPIDWKARMK